MFNKIRRMKWFIPIVAVLLAGLVVGTVFAAIVYTVPISHSGSVVSNGGEGNPPPSNTFTVTGAGVVSGSTIVWGNINMGANVEKTVIITLTGNQSVNVTPDLTSIPACVTLSATPASVSLSPSSPVASMVLKMTGISVADFSFSTNFNATSP